MHQFNEQILDLLDEWERRRDEGRPATPEELTQGVPALAAQLREAIKLLRDGEWMETQKTIVSPDLKGASKESPTYSGKNPLGPYQLLESLGQGGMGAVYKAKHIRLNKYVAIKVLPESLTRSVEAVARFDREMKAVGALEHPNIVRAMDANEDQGTHYLVMEYIEGQDLHSLVREQGPFSVPEACRLIHDAALALHYAHESGLVHRDIKPANLFLTKAGQLKVLDLGLARLVSDAADDSGLTHTGVSLGTPDYMAPEQWADSHTADARTDLYALGCTLYYLLIGRPPFGIPQYRTVIGKMTAHAQGMIPGMKDGGADVPEKLDQLYQKLLAKDPEARIQTGSQVAKELEPFLQIKTSPPRPAPIDPTSVELPSQPRVEARRTTVPRGVNRGRLLLVTVGLALTLAAVFFATRDPKAALSPSTTSPMEVAETPSTEPLSEPPREIATNHMASAEIAPPNPVMPKLMTANGWLDALALVEVDRMKKIWGYDSAWARDEDGITHDSTQNWGLLAIPVNMKSNDYEVEFELTAHDPSRVIRFDIAHPLGCASLSLNVDSTTEVGSLKLTLIAHERATCRLHVELLPDRVIATGGMAGRPAQRVELSNFLPINHTTCMDSTTNGIATSPGAPLQIHAIRLRANQGDLYCDVPRIDEPNLPSFVKRAPLSGLVPDPSDLPERWQIARRALSSIEVAAWSSDGKWIAVADNSGKIGLLNAKTFQLVRILAVWPKDNGAFSLSWQPGGSKLLTRQGNDVYLFDLATNKWTAVAHGRPFSIAWNNTGTKFAIGGHWHDQTVRAFSDEGKLLFQHRLDHNMAQSIAWSRDDTTLFVSTQNSVIRLINQGATLERLNGVSNAGHLATCPHEDLLAIGRMSDSGPNYVEIWDYSANQIVGRVDASDQLAWPISLAFGPTSNLLAIGTQSFHAEVIDWKTQARLIDVFTEAPCGSIAWNPEGTALACIKNNWTLVVAPLEKGVNPYDAGEVNGIVQVHVCPTDQNQIAKTYNRTVSIYHPGQKQGVLRENDDVYYDGPSWTPDGKAYLYWNREAGTLINSENNLEITRFRGATWGMNRSAWSRDGEILVAAHHTLPTLIVWNRDGSERRRISTEDRATSALAVSPNKKWVAVGFSTEASKGFQLWNLETGEKGDTFGDDNRWSVQQLYWVDDELVLVASGGTQMRLWNIVKREEIKERVRESASRIVPRLKEPENPWIVHEGPAGKWRLTSFDGTRTLDTLTLRDSFWTFDSVDNGQEVSVIGDNTVHTLNSNTGELLRIAILLPNHQVATIDPNGNVLHQTSKADDELVYLLERPDGTLKDVTPAEFRTYRKSVEGSSGGDLPNASSSSASGMQSTAARTTGEQAVDYAADRKAAAWLSENIQGELYLAVRTVRNEYVGISSNNRQLPTDDFVVEQVHLNGCGIDDDGLANLSGCRHIQIVFVHHEPRITAKGLRHFTSSRGLKDLHIAFSGGIDGKLIAFLPAWQELKSLSMSHCSINPEDQLAWPAMPQLISLNLNDAPLTPEGLRAIVRQCPNLEGATVSKPNGDPQPWALSSLASLPNLRFVSCNVAQLNDEGIKALKALPHLTRLHVISPLHDSSASLQNILPLAASITDLSVGDYHPDGPDLSEADIATILQFKRLKSLNLFGPWEKGSITDEQLQQIADFPDLHELELGFDEPHRRYKPAGIDAFRQRRPDVNLVVDGARYPAETK